MITSSSAQSAQDDSEAVYTLPLARGEAVASWRALDDWPHHTSESIRAMYRLVARLQQPEPDAGAPRLHGG